MIEISACVNGIWRKELVPANETLLQYLRDSLGLKGAVEGCGMGACGACTVLVDGEAISACLMLAVDIDEREVTTIEGLGSDDALDPVQQAFLDHHAFQCGFCTPAMILTVKALLQADPTPSVSTIRDFVSGNICRCGTYLEVLRAAMSLAEKGRDKSDQG